MLHSQLRTSLLGLEGVDDKLLQRPAFALLPDILEKREEPVGVAWNGNLDVYIATDRRIIRFTPNFFRNANRKVTSYQYSNIRSFHADTGFMSLGCNIVMVDGTAQKLPMKPEARQRFAAIVRSHMPTHQMGKSTTSPVTPSQSVQDPPLATPIPTLPPPPTPPTKKGMAWWKWVGIGVVAFLGFMIIIGVLFGETDDDKSALGDAATKPTPTLAPTTTEIPLTSFSDEALDLRSVFQELIKFKDEPWFHVYCYSLNGPAARWAEYVKNMDSGTFHETGIVPMDLWLMGSEYCFNEGMETEDTQYWLRQMESDWVNYRPIPLPKPEYAAPERPYQDISERLGSCLWNNPDLHSLLPDAIEASNNATDVGMFLEVVLDGAEERSTLDGALNILVAYCP